MRAKSLVAVLAVAGVLGVAGCGGISTTEQGGKHPGLREAETKVLEKQEGVGHQEAEREAREAIELAERVQRSGIKLK
jgi:hypothetical protein